MTHAYHPACGCSACCDEELADERRGEYIEDFAPAVAKKLVGSEDFAADKLTDLASNPDVVRWILRDAGVFFERFHNTPEERAAALLGIAGQLYRDLLPYIEAAAMEQAEMEVAAEYDQADAA